MLVPHPLPTPSPEALFTNFTGVNIPTMATNITVLNAEPEGAEHNLFWTTALSWLQHTSELALLRKTGNYLSPSAAKEWLLFYDDIPERDMALESKAQLRRRCSTEREMTCWRLENPFVGNRDPRRKTNGYSICEVPPWNSPIKVTPILRCSTLTQSFQ